MSVTSDGAAASAATTADLTASSNCRRAWPPGSRSLGGVRMRLRLRIRRSTGWGDRDRRLGLDLDPAVDTADEVLGLGIDLDPAVDTADEVLGDEQAGELHFTRGTISWRPDISGILVAEEAEELPVRERRRRCGVADDIATKAAISTVTKATCQASRRHRHQGRNQKGPSLCEFRCLSQNGYGGQSGRKYPAQLSGDLDRPRHRGDMEAFRAQKQP